MSAAALPTLKAIFESWWFDPLTATVGFGVPIIIYTYYEVKSGNSTYTNFGQFFAADDSSGDRAGNDHGVIISLITYWIGVLVFVQVFPKPGGGIEPLPYGIPDSFSSLGILAAEVISGIVLYDAIFFIIHWSMHECKALHFLSHKEHHRPKNLEARHVLT